MIKTKIVATLGPTSSDKEIIRAIIESGARVIRINFSHGTHDEHRERIAAVREITNELKIAVAVLVDLCGPKIRTGETEKPMHLNSGDKFILTTRNDYNFSANEMPLSYKDLPQYLKKGERILFDDGNFEAVVDHVDGTDIHLTATITAPLGSRKGINVPGVELPISAITEKDEKDLRFALNEDIDWVAMSFVRSAKDINTVKDIMADEGVFRPIMAKIEQREAIQNIDEIISAYDAVMVARGDMGVEMSIEQVPTLQKEIIKKANAAGKPVVTATQMLDSMIRNPRPTRAEATDVTNAILDGTDAVMLSGETAAGNYPIEAVKTMAILAELAEDIFHQRGQGFCIECMDESQKGVLDITVADSAVAIAMKLGAKAIIAAGSDSYTATLVSKSRPNQTVIAATSDFSNFNQMSVLWGVLPYYIKTPGTMNEDLDRAVRFGVQNGIVENGDLVVIVKMINQPLGIVTRGGNQIRLAYVDL